MTAQYPRVPSGIDLTAVERDRYYYGQILFGDQVVWESSAKESPTLAYQQANEHLASVMKSMLSKRND